MKPQNRKQSQNRKQGGRIERKGSRPQEPRPKGGTRDAMDRGQLADIRQRANEALKRARDGDARW